MRSRQCVAGREHALTQEVTDRRWEARNEAVVGLNGPPQLIVFKHCGARVAASREQARSTRASSPGASAAHGRISSDRPQSPPVCHGSGEESFWGQTISP